MLIRLHSRAASRWVREIKDHREYMRRIQRASPSALNIAIGGPAVPNPTASNLNPPNQTAEKPTAQQTNRTEKTNRTRKGWDKLPAKVRNAHLLKSYKMLSSYTLLASKLVS